MNRSIRLLFVFSAASLFLLSACKQDKCTQTRTYKSYEPVYLSLNDIRNGVSIGAAQPLQTPGKIYITGNYIFVTESGKGIHVFDNTNPASPQNISFITIPGNVDINGTGTVLYADSYIDLVCFDISNPASPRVLNRVKNAFPNQLQLNYSYQQGYVDTSKGLVVDYKAVMKTEKVGEDCGQSRRSYGIEDKANVGVMYSTTTNAAPTANVSTQPSSKVGSEARFAVANNHLYIVDNSSLHNYDISNPASPVVGTTSNLGWSIETIFPYQNKLFIGSSSGVYIYDISNPASPNQLSVYNHMTACDPVVVEGNYAYFTLSNDAPCHMGVNELEVVDISNPSSPSLVKTYPMTNPKGLGIDNGTLFLCDGSDGLKVFDAHNVNTITDHAISHFSSIQATDVIPYNKHLLTVGTDGLYQYDYSNVNNITLLSKISVSK